MTDATILLNGFSIIGDPRTNTNASGGGELMIHDGVAVFENDDIVVFLVENANPDGSLSDDSIITGVIVYDNATDYFNEVPLYTYETDPSDPVSMSEGRNGMGDTYLQIDASPLTSSDPDAPVLGDLTMVAGVDILGTLASGRGPLEIGTIQDIDLDGDGTPDAIGDGILSGDINSLLVICFALGTLIDTPSGPTPVEALKTGRLVNTLDHGPQPIRWIGSSRVDASGDNAPICIRRGALGNVRDLLVSPNHRLLLRGPLAELLFAQPEVLVEAKHLVDGIAICRVPMREIEYFHFLTDQHDIVFAEACPAETLYPGRMSLNTVSSSARDEITALFPELAQEDYPIPLSRPQLRRYEAQALRKIA